MSDSKVEIFIVGAPKAGTSSIYHYLKDHSEVQMSEIKEPNYFTQQETVNLYSSKSYRSRYKIICNEDEYHSLYTCSERIRGDASVSYLYYPTVAKKIKKYNSGAKIIICLRNPVDRAISHHAMDFRLGFTDKPLDYVLDNRNSGSTEYQQYVSVGCYSEQIDRYIVEFGLDRIKFVWFEALIESPEEVCRDLCRFLEITYDSGTLTHRNKAKESKYKAVRAMYRSAIFRKICKNVFSDKYIVEIKRIFFNDVYMTGISRHEKYNLQELFRKDIQQLEIRLGVDLSSWKSYVYDVLN